MQPKVGSSYESVAHSSWRMRRERAEEKQQQLKGGHGVSRDFRTWEQGVKSRLTYKHAPVAVTRVLSCCDSYLHTFIRSGFLPPAPRLVSEWQMKPSPAAVGPGTRLICQGFDDLCKLLERSLCCSARTQTALASQTRGQSNESSTLVLKIPIS